MSVFITIMTIIIIVSLGDLGGTPLFQDAGRRDIVETWRTAAAPNRTQTSGRPELTNLGTFRHPSVDIGEQTRERHMRTEPEVDARVATGEAR